MDIDLVADIQRKHAPLLVNLLESAYYIDRDMILEAIQRQASCNLIHLETMLKAEELGLTDLFTQVYCDAVNSD